MDSNEKPLSDLVNSDSISERLAAMKQLGARMAKAIYSDGEDQPIAAIICVVGRSETAEVVEALQEIEERWDAE